VASVAIEGEGKAHDTPIRVNAPRILGVLRFSQVGTLVVWLLKPLLFLIVPVDQRSVKSTFPRTLSSKVVIADCGKLRLCR